MAASKRIVVMISSRCKDRIRTRDGKWRTFTELRKEVKDKVELAEFGIHGIVTFECWVHEHEPALSSDTNFWEQCLDQVRDCDLMLALYNGNAGFANNAGDLGICHAELMEAMRTAPGKVRIIEVTGDAWTRSERAKPEPEDAARDTIFAQYVEGLQRGKRFASSYEEARELLCESIQDAVVDLVRLGGREIRKGKYYEGESLDWSRDSFAVRKKRMEAVLRNSLAANGDDVVLVNGERILFRCHGVPSAMSTAAAREMVGRPFLRDHESIEDLARQDAYGPVHLIACHKGVTETQATNLLGFPDAMVVTPPFGVYVADPVQNIQLVFLANCRDASATWWAVQRFREWMESPNTEEAPRMAERAKHRRRIAQAIAEAAGASAAAGSAP